MARARSSNNNSTANLGRQAMVDWSSSDKTLSAGKARRVSAGSANQFQQFVTPDGRKFTELDNVQHLTSNKLDGVCRVTICTIQRLYAMLRGEELNEDLDEKSGFEIAAAHQRTRDVQCHRSIYNLWRQVLEYFDAFLIRLTATPGKQAIGFFSKNLVNEYPHERAVADGVSTGIEPTLWLSADKRDNNASFCAFLRSA